MLEEMVLFEGVLRLQNRAFELAASRISFLMDTAFMLG